MTMLVLLILQSRRESALVVREYQKNFSSSSVFDAPGFISFLEMKF